MKFIEKFGPIDTMRALSWKQPYASLMLHGKVESRLWNTKYRGWVLICASKEPYTFGTVLEISEHHTPRVDRTLKMQGSLNYRALPLGHAIAVGYLTSTKFMGDYVGNKASIETIEEKCFVGFNEALWMHEYTNVHQIVPIPYKGAQGWRLLGQEFINSIELL